MFAFMHGYIHTHTDGVCGVTIKDDVCMYVCFDYLRKFVNNLYVCFPLYKNNCSLFCLAHILVCV